MALPTISCYSSCTKIDSTWKSSPCWLQSESWLRKGKSALPTPSSISLSRFRSSTEFVFDAVHERSQCPRVKFTANPNIRVLINWNFNVRYNPLPKNVSVVVVRHYAFSIPIGSLKMRRSNSTRSFSSIRFTKESEKIRASTGFVKRIRNTENYAV